MDVNATLGLHRAIGSGEVEFEADCRSRRQIVRGYETHATCAEVEHRAVVWLRFSIK
jgi:hypothetical protein